MSTHTALKIVDLHFAYGQREVLSNISLEVRKGEVLGLVGPNGAGKSTLLRLIGGTLKPQRGSVLLEGGPLLSLTPVERARRIALVPQNPTAPPGFTCLEAVLMARSPHLRFLQWEGPQDLAISQRAMELTATWELAARLLQLLSGGERQRVFIARALAQEAPILLLDEPTAHLDIAYQTAIMDMIDEVRQQTGITVVAAMHDLTLAGQYCRRIAVLHEGRIVAVGPPEEVLTSERVSTIYGTHVSVSTHPTDGTPVVLPSRRADRSRESPSDPGATH